MTDREKIVWSLERCASSVPDACSDCKYDNFPPRICVAHLAKDALALIKAQEPRVLTLEEVRQAGTMCFVETRHNGRLHSMIFNDFFKDDDTTVFLSYIGDLPFKNAGYGKSWRCWSAKPTDEQREATPWID